MCSCYDLWTPTRKVQIVWKALVVAKVAYDTKDAWGMFTLAVKLVFAPPLQMEVIIFVLY
jgi:hypothetical protein